MNGYTSGPIPIKCSVRQGCPLSTQLFAICLDPLLCTLEKTLTGIRIGSNNNKTTVTAYADDVTIFVTTPLDIPKIQEAINNYTAASGAKINITKSKAMPVGPWDTNINIMNIPYHKEVKILGAHFTSTTQQSTIKKLDNSNGQTTRTGSQRI
jgi:hypothetical protein